MYFKVLLLFRSSTVLLNLSNATTVFKKYDKLIWKFFKINYVIGSNTKLNTKSSLYACSFNTYLLKFSSEISK